MSRRNLIKQMNSVAVADLPGALIECLMACCRSNTRRCRTARTPRLARTRLILTPTLERCVSQLQKAATEAVQWNQAPISKGLMQGPLIAIGARDFKTASGHAQTSLRTLEARVEVMQTP